MKKHRRLALDFRSLTDTKKESVIERSTREIYILDGGEFSLPVDAFRGLAKTLLVMGRYDDYLKFDREQREIVMQLLIDEEAPIETPFVLNDLMNSFSHDVKNRLISFFQ